MMKQSSLIGISVLLTGMISSVGYYIYCQEIRMRQIEQTSERTEQAVNEIKTLIVHEMSQVTYSSKDEECMAKNIYHEAGVESDNGKIAVGQVTLNRLKTKRWGDTICSVVYAKSQFSWTLFKSKRNERPTGPLWDKSKYVAKLVLSGVHIKTLKNGLFYHTDYIKQPKWADKNHRITQIDQHIFYAKTLQAVPVCIKQKNTKCSSIKIAA